MRAQAVWRRISLVRWAATLACTFSIACVVVDPACSPRPEPHAPGIANTARPLRADAAAPTDASSSARPPCNLEVPADGTPCQAGEVDYRGDFLSCCPATCDAMGHWKKAGPCRSAACGNSAVYFARGDAEPHGVNLTRQAQRLAQSSGRYYVLAQVAPDEQDIPGLDLARANAVKARLVALGFCEEKLIPLAGGVVGQFPEGYRLQDRMRPLGELIRISDYADQQLRDAGILD